MKPYWLFFIFVGSPLLCDGTYSLALSCGMVFLQTRMLSKSELAIIIGHIIVIPIVVIFKIMPERAAPAAAAAAASSSSSSFSSSPFILKFLPVFDFV